MMLPQMLNFLALPICTSMGKCISFHSKLNRLCLPRELLKTAKLVLKAKEFLEQQRKREVSLSEVSSYLGISESQASEALAATNSEAVSLDEMREDDTNLYNMFAAGDTHVDEMLDLKEAVANLESPDREIFLLRYCNDYTQNELADMFNMSQVSVSRLLSRNLKRVKSALSSV